MPLLPTKDFMAVASQLVCFGALQILVCTSTSVPAAGADSQFLGTASSEYNSRETRWNELVRKALPLNGEPDLSLLRRAKAEAERLPQPDIRLAATLCKLATQPGPDFAGPKDDNLRTLERAVEICRKCDRTTNVYLPISLFHLSREYYGHKRYEDARKALEEALPMFIALEGTLSLNVAHAQEELGYVYAMLGSPELGKSMFIKAGRAYYQMDPDAGFDIDRCASAASICLMRGRQITAADQAFLEDCMGVTHRFSYPKQPGDLVRLAMIYLEEHKPALAKEKLQDAIQLFKSKTPCCAGHQLSGQSYLSIGPGRASFETVMNNLFSIDDQYLGEYLDDPATQALAEKLLKQAEP